MRTATIVGAALVTASIGVTAAALPPPQATQEKAGPPPARTEQGKQTRREFRLFGSREAQIGVSVRDLDAEQARSGTGAVVENVTPGSPAERAGIRAGDVVTSFDGEKVRSARQLARLVEETAPGRTVPATVIRDGKRIDLQLTPEAGAMTRFDDEFVMPAMPDLERMPDLNLDGRMFRFDRDGSGRFFNRRVPDGKGQDFEFFTNPDRARLGIGIQEITAQLAEYFGAEDGVLVTTVEQDSPAAQAGLKAGDVITSINGTAVKSTGDVMRAVQEAGDNAELTIAYVRDRKPATAKAKLTAREERKRGRPI